MRYPILQAFPCSLIALSLELPEDALVEKHTFDGIAETASWFLFSFIMTYIDGHICSQIYEIVSDPSS
jgi:hypothetical protein